MSASGSSPGRLWVRSMLVVGMVVIVAIAAASISVATSSNDDRANLLHTVRRGDLAVSVTEQGTLESSNNTEIKCKVRGWSTVIWVIEGGTEVKPGDELVRLDTKNIEETVSLQKTNVHTATATLERSKADVAKAEISINAYLDGQYRSQLKKPREIDIGCRIQLEHCREDAGSLQGNVQAWLCQ